MNDGKKATERAVPVKADKRAGGKSHERVSLSKWTKKTGTHMTNDQVWKDAVAEANEAFKEKAKNPENGQEE